MDDSSSSLLFQFRPASGRAKGQTFSIWDVGGQEKLRPLWRSYIRRTDAIVFVVDSTDVDRFEEAKLELVNLMRLAELPATVPILLIANKQDLPTASTETQVETAVGLRDIAGTQHPCRTMPACAVTGEGLEQLFDVLYEMIQTSRQLDRTRHKKR